MSTVQSFLTVKPRRSSRRNRALRVGGVLLAMAAAILGGGCNNAGEGALSGAALGAGAGAIIGSLTGSAGRGAIIGGAAGALGGGLLGDQNARNRSNSNNTGYYR